MYGEIYYNASNNVREKGGVKVNRGKGRVSERERRSFINGQTKKRELRSEREEEVKKETEWCG